MIVREALLAARSLRRAPSTWIVPAVLGVVVALVATLGNVMESLIWRPVTGVDSPDRAVVIGGIVPEASVGDPVSWWLEAPGLERLARFSVGDVLLESPRDRRQVRASAVTSQFLSVFGIAPIHGRDFGPGDEEAHRRVAIVGKRLWDAAFDSDVATLPVDIKLNHQTYSVVGIVPPRFDFPESSELWIVRPADAYSDVLTADHPQLPPVRLRGSWVGRLAPSSSVDRVRSELLGILSRTNEQLYSKTGMKFGDVIRVRTVADEISVGYRPLLTALWAGSLMVLLAVCLQASVFFLGRAWRRKAELSLRYALGASAGRLVRVIALDTLLLGALSATTAMVVSIAFVSIGRQILFNNGFVFARDSHSSGLIAALAFLICIFVVGLAGLLPAYQARRRDAAQLLRVGANVSGEVQPFARGLLVALSTAVAVVLSVGAMVTTKAMLDAARVDRGFGDVDTVVAELRFPREEVANDRLRRLQNDLLADVTAAAGPAAAGFGSAIPIRTASRRFRAVGPAGDMMASVVYVTPDFLSSIGIRLLRGSTVVPQAGDSVVVNDTLAKRLWPRGDDVGQWLQIGNRQWLISGVVATTVAVDDDRRHPEIYLPYEAQAIGRPVVFMQLAVRCDGRPACRAEALQAVADRYGPAGEGVVAYAGILHSRLAEAQGPLRNQATIASAFALIALFVLCSGVWTLVSYATNTRKYEIGIRLSVGASPRSIALLLARDCLRAGAVGIVVGALAARGSAGVLEGLLGVAGWPGNEVIGTSVVAVFAVLAAGAGFPILRTLASRESPLRLLRNP